MAQKVFRLHTGQLNSGWFNSVAPDTNALKSIITDGKYVASSIPSPFATFDLVKSAFKWVSENDINGQSAHHKLVSDALDVAQLLFYYETHKDKIKIVSYDPKKQIAKMLTENNGHKLLAQSLNTFWNEDADVYNFNKVNKLYFILNSKKDNKIIGSTSPTSLFIAAPDVKEVTEGLNINCGADTLFDDNYCSLAERSKDFIIYFFSLSKCKTNFANLFPEVYSYLDAVKKHFEINNADLLIKISELDNNSINNYATCPVLDNPANTCEILGIPLGINSIKPETIADVSDFVIKTDYSNNTLMPLVLPCDTFNQTWVYNKPDNIWDQNFKAPIKNNNIDKSVLPQQGDNYPWLGRDNFLTDKIIKLNYSIDSNRFVTCGASKFLLPLSKTFFEYFKVDKIKIEEYLSIDELSGGGVNVKLNIPVKKGIIPFSKLYSKDEVVALDDIHLAVLPFIKTNHIALDYYIGLLDARINRNNNVNISCYNDNQKIDITEPVLKSKGNDKTNKSSYYETKEFFNAISLETDNINNYIIPIYNECNGNSSIKFSVDFGTTNTHIEYKVDGFAEKALDFEEYKPVWQSLINKKDTKNDAMVISDSEIFYSELFPNFTNDIFKFPLRTALAINKETVLSSRISVFKNTNNYLLYEKIAEPRYFDIALDIKWSSFSNNNDIISQDRVKTQKYIENLLHFCLYKTLLEGANPKTAEIIWFYPVSMDSNEKNNLIEFWNKAYKNIFKNGNLNNLIAIQESIAPYMHHRIKNTGLSLSIDIGGGSSDIAYFVEGENKPKFISSVKFAGNSIFGDGLPGTYKKHSNNNGFVNSFKEYVKSEVIKNTNKSQIFENVEKRNNSAELCNLFFALENDNEINFNFTESLKDSPTLKLPFLIFYSALLYYSARILKEKNLEKPKNILLSGTASKTSLLLDSVSYNNLNDYADFIFNKIIENNSNKIKFDITDMPKQITCKGGLLIDEKIEDTDIYYWLGGFDSEKWGAVLSESMSNKEKPVFENIDENARKSIINSIMNMYTIIDEYFDNKDITRSFGITKEAYQKFKDIREDDLSDNIIRGIDAFNKQKNNPIEESLFFYPLISLLNKLAYELSKKDTNE